MSTPKTQAETISVKITLRWIIMPFAAIFYSLLAYIPFVLFVELMPGEFFSAGVFFLGMSVTLFYSGYLYMATAIKISPTHKKQAALSMMAIWLFSGVMVLLALPISQPSGDIIEIADFSNGRARLIYKIVVVGLLMSLAGAYYKYRKVFSVKGLF